jgi:c(7)-type cytochrome triheme protein
MKLRNLFISASTLVLCTVCSAMALNIKDMTFATKEAGKVVFSHNYHIRQRGITNNCTACHNGIFDMKKKVRYTMADMVQGKSCGACHNRTTAFGLNDCARCHKVRDVIVKVKETGPVLFSHRVHTRNRPCTNCHTRLYTTAGPHKRTSMAQMERGKSCGACHNGKSAFAIGNCTRCHPVKEVIFAVKETGPTRFSHTSHLAQYRCESCHMKLYAAGRNKRVSMAQMTKGTSCGACHDAKTAFGVSECTKCHPVKEQEFVEKSAGNVMFSHSFHLQAATCGECHPGNYLPGKAKRGVTMAEMRQGRSCGACHDGKTAFSARGNCDKCHKS